jgi:exosortase A-associated hydrolase 1
MTAAAHERALVFECRGEQLVAIVASPSSPPPRGVLIVVGGPSYRAGSHRQFTLLSRSLAAAGIACMRFDVRGMGDSSGGARTFEAIHDDLLRAIDVFLAEVPALEQVVLWALCDGASAALMFGTRHPCVGGLVLLNPWVRNPVTLSQARIKHYYSKRLLSRELWSKALRGGVDWRGSAASLLATLRSAHAPRDPATASCPVKDSVPFQDRMAAGLTRFSGPVLLILSGNDLTAQEFLDCARQDPVWRQALARPNVARVDMPRANHTFARGAWRAEVERATLHWLKDWEADAAAASGSRQAVGGTHG